MRRLIDESQDESLRPERTKQGFAEKLRPIARKKSVRAVARFKRDAPVVVCVETIRRYHALSGLSKKDIADLIGCDRKTVAAALRCDESTNLWTFCEVLNVIGMEPALAFPMRKKMRKKDVPVGPTWQRGRFHSTANLAHDVALIKERKSMNRRKKWA